MSANRIDRVPELLLAAADVCLARGLLAHNCLVRFTAGAYVFAINGGGATREGIAPYTLVVTCAGWPVAICDPGGGALVGGTTEAELLAVLTSAAGRPA